MSPLTLGALYGVVTIVVMVLLGDVGAADGRSGPADGAGGARFLRLVLFAVQKVVIIEIVFLAVEVLVGRDGVLVGLGDKALFVVVAVEVVLVGLAFADEPSGAAVASGRGERVGIAAFAVRSVGSRAMPDAWSSRAMAGLHIGSAHLGNERVRACVGWVVVRRRF